MFNAEESKGGGRKRVLDNFTLEGQAESYEDVFLNLSKSGAERF